MQGEEQESDTVGNFCTKVSTPLKHTDNMELRTAREQQGSRDRLPPPALALQQVLPDDICAY